MFSREIRAIRERDPASRSTVEAILTSSGLHAIALHRVAHWLWRKGLFLPARLLSQLSQAITGIEIHPGARIGQGVFIDHGMGVVIGETASVGDDVTMYQGVTLGGTGKQRGKRHPTVEDPRGHRRRRVGARRVTIGEGARVGAGRWYSTTCQRTHGGGDAARAVSWRDPASGDAAAGAPTGSGPGHDDLAHAADRGARGARARDRARPCRPGAALSLAIDSPPRLRLTSEETGRMTSHEPRAEIDPASGGNSRLQHP